MRGVSAVLSVSIGFWMLFLISSGRLDALGCLVRGWLPTDFLELETLRLSECFRLLLRDAGDLDNFLMLPSRITLIYGDFLAPIDLLTSENLSATVLSCLIVGFGDVEATLLLCLEL